LRDRIAADCSVEIWQAASESMSRLLPCGNLVAIEKRVAISIVQIGEIILNRKPVPDYEAAAVISRIIGRRIDPEDQLVTYYKGRC
jgi:hypothetical protein